MTGRQRNAAAERGAPASHTRTPLLRLRAKLALLAVVPFVVLSTVLLLGVTYQFERLSEQTIGKQEMEISSPVQQAIEAAVRNARESLGTAAARIAGLGTLDEAAIRQALKQEDQLSLLFSEGLLVTDLENNVVASVGPVRNKREKDTAFLFPFPSPNFLVSLPFEALTESGHPAVAQTVPIVIDGQIRGNLSGACDLFGPRYLGPYRSTRFGESGYISLTAPNRVLILHKDPKRVLQWGGPPGINHAIDRGLEGWEGWMNTRTTVTAMITAIRQVPSTGWVLSVHYPKRLAQSPFLTARRDLMVAVALGATVLLGLILFLSRRMVRPLSAMTKQVEALTEGTSDVLLVPVHSNDEIGVLSKAFNRLVQERSAAEAELRASEERFRLAFRTSPEPMALTRVRDHVLVAVNEGFEKLFRVSEAQALGHTVAQLGITMEAPDQDTHAKPALERGILPAGLLRATTADRRTIDLSVASSLLNVRGESHLLTISRDVTALRAAEAAREQLTLELQKSEERHRRVVRNVPVVQWALDNDGVFTLAEGLALLSLGRRAERMVGANIFELYADNKQILLYFSQAKKGQVIAGPFEQGDAAFESHWGPLRDEAGTIVGVTAIALDVSSRMRAEQARRETEQRMSVLERLAATGRLAAGVAHEINNPLTYVLSNLDEIEAQLAAREGTETIRTCAREAMDGAKRVAAIVRDLRVFSGRPQPGQSRCQPSKVVDSAVTLMRNQIRHRARLEIDNRLPPDAAIESGRLAQVLVNLLMNACQAIPEGNVEANLIRVTVASASSTIIIEVSDTGEGIASETIPHLFEPFFTTRKIGEGSGLGLSVSYALVSEVGGTIEVKSAKGTGAMFTVKIPVSKGNSAEFVEPLQTPSPVVRRLRILVVDDEAPVGRALARYLSEHEVVLETRAQAGLERLRRGERFDAILTDMMMPEMSGIQFYDHLRRELPELIRRVVFMSGGVFGPEALAFVEREKPVVYEKPLDVQQLLAHLHDLGEGRTRS
jgi:PAS domain S-box-containing protein